MSGWLWCWDLALGWLGVGYVLLGFFAANVIGAVIGLVVDREEAHEPKRSDPVRRVPLAGVRLGGVRGTGALASVHHHTF